MIKSLVSFLVQNKTNKLALKAIITSAILSIIIRTIGFFKESAIAYYFGVSQYVDFYLLALIYAIFFVHPIGGALSTLLTQKYIEMSEKVSKLASANIYIKSQIFGIGIMIIIISTQVALLEFQFIQNIIETKFGKINMRYIYFLIPIGLISFISLVNGSILTAKKQFKTFTILPVLVPISILVFLFSFPSEFKFEALLIGTLIGFALELLVSKLSLKTVLLKFDYNLIKKSSRDFSKIIKSMPSLVLSGIIMSGCLIVDQLMAVLAGEGAVAMINFGNRIALGLISILAIVWTVLYPYFIRYTSINDFKSLRKILGIFSLLIVIFLIPLCGSLAIFSEEIISILYERGAFVRKDTIIVANIQMFYFLHLPLYALCMICTRVANALENTQVILIGNILLLISNIIFNLFLIDKYGVIGIPIATLISYSLIALFWFITSNLLISNKLKN